MTALAALMGQLRLRAGPGDEPAIRSSRPVLAERLAAGRPAAQLPDLLGAAFALCGGAHRWAAAQAVRAAQGDAAPATFEARRAHRWATAREHGLRIAIDWPRLLPGAPSGGLGAAALRGSPLFDDAAATDAGLAALPGWLAQAWLGLPCADWLAAWHADAAGWPPRWLARHDTPLTRLLRTQAAARELPAPGPSLNPLADAARSLPALARRMADEPHFCARPDMGPDMGPDRAQGGPDGVLVPDTGPWSRAGTALPAHSAWDRLMARLAELVQLSLDEGDAALALGGLALAPGAGLAWIEMARGLLLHRVELDDGSGEPRVRRCLVLAPTEWNFHPQGVLAHALRALPAGPASAPAVAQLAVAFDPCVPWVIPAAGRMGEDAAQEHEVGDA